MEHRRFTITEIAEVVIGLDARQHPAAHRALRKAAQLGALGEGERIDARGTQVFGPEALFRGALIVALAAAEIHGAEAARAIEIADANGFRLGRLRLARAIEAVTRGELVQFRRIVPGRLGTGVPSPWWGQMYVPAAAPLPEAAESILAIQLNTVWAPCFRALAFGAPE